MDHFKRKISRTKLSFAAAMLSLLPLAGVGCATKGQAESPKALSPDAPLPVVVSGTPRHDALVLQESDRQLSATTWDKLEQRGPKPVWQKDKDGKLVGASAEENGSLHVTSTHDEAIATTQPTKLLTGVNEAELPVKIVELADGKLRLVWVLRSYGGAAVTSLRDVNTQRHTVTVAAPDLAPLVAAVTKQLGTLGTVDAVPANNTLIVTCDKSIKASVLDLLARLDVVQKQVEITAKIFEVSHDFDYQQGAHVLAKHLSSDNTSSGSSNFDTQNFLNSTASNSTFQGSVISLMQASHAAGMSFEMSMQLLAQAGLITVVSSPRMTVAVGQTGYMLAGQEIPIQTANIINNNLQTTTTYKPVGVQLFITPEAVSRNKIKLHTISIVSSVAGFTPMTAIDGVGSPQTVLNPIIDSREAETQVTVEDGNTLVISGLRMVKTTTREDKVPGLGDIPVLGWLFKSQRSQQQSTDLYFFVTPTML